MNTINKKPFLTPGLYFMLTGPLVGLGLVLAALILITLVYTPVSDPKDIPELLMIGLMVAFGGLFVAYIIGTLPALITGMIAGKGKTRSEQLTYAVISGAISCFLLSFAMNRELNFNITACILGALSGLFCALLWRRKYNQRI